MATLTFLHLAEEERFDELKQALDLAFTDNVKIDIDFNVTNKYSQTMLYFASRRNQIELCKMLLDRGANPDIGDCDGFTPLHEAAGRGFKDLVEILLQYGANINARTSDKGTVLHMVAFNPTPGALETFHFLLEKGAYVLINVRNMEGVSALMKSIIRVNFPVFKCLLEIRAEKYRKNGYNQTPLDLARMSEQYEMEDLILREIWYDNLFLLFLTCF
jgi:ankyrin repeat protein